MALPKISHPTFDVKVPSNNKKIKIRPMLVKEEKILLMAKTETDETAQDSIFSSIIQVVNNCVLNDDVDVEKLPLIDIEYLFIKLRAVSVNNITQVSFLDNEDNETYNFDVDLNEVKVVFDDTIEKNIKASDDLQIVMKYSPCKIYIDDTLKNAKPEDILDHIIAKSIDKIFYNDEVTDVSTIDFNELLEYIEDNIDTQTYEKMRKFVINSPKLEYTIEYTNKNKTKREIKLNSLTDFFMLR